MAELASDGLVWRLGGDEFAAILADRRDDDRPRMLAQAILDRLREPRRIEGGDVLALLGSRITVAA